MLARKALGSVSIPGEGTQKLGDAVESEAADLWEESGAKDEASWSAKPLRNHGRQLGYHGTATGWGAENLVIEVRIDKADSLAPMPLRLQKIQPRPRLKDRDRRGNRQDRKDLLRSPFY